jgi:hypothetical protein
MKSVVSFALQVLEMEDEILALRKENKLLLEYKDKYEKLLSNSIKHNDIMMRNTLGILMTPGVCEAFSEGHKNETT